MEKYNVAEDVTVFGMEVTDFPVGVQETFEALVKMISDKFDRSYFGIFEMKGDRMVYVAAAEEKEKGEAQKYHCERYRIKKGIYLAETIWNWRTKTNTINGVFHELQKDQRIDRTAPGIEWYKNDQEMLCMLKIDSTKPKQIKVSNT
ncbi:MAG: hypothetical protein ACOYXT_27555 [Bacteroidota bacterium]